MTTTEKEIPVDIPKESVKLNKADGNEDQPIDFEIKKLKRDLTLQN